MALVLEKTGAPQGNANPNLYSLANLQLSSNGVAIFHDITSGNNSVPGVTGFNAGTGYDQATGLGSVDANLLVNHWNDTRALTFSLTPSASGANVAVGTPARITLTTAAVNGFKSAITLSLSGLPRGVTSGFSPTTIVAPGNGTSTLTLTETTGATSGTYNPTVTATGGGMTKTLPLSLSVVTPTFTLARSVASANVAVGSSAKVTFTTAATTGFNSALTLSVSGVPQGVRAGFSLSTIAAPGSGASTMTLTETPGAISGTYNLTVTATGGGVTKIQPLSLRVVAPSFTMRLSSTSVSMKQGGSMPIAVTTTAVNGFNSAVALSVSGLPKGVTASFARSSIPAPGNGGTTLTLKVASGTGANVGTYSLTVTGTGGGVTQTQKLTLTITH
jgi:uncharacterized membrane protein